MLRTLVLWLAFLGAVAAGCREGGARSGGPGTALLPLEAPPGYEGSCAERVRSWREVRLAPDDGEPFLCFDAPRNGAGAPLGSPVALRGWAGYPARPDVAIQLQIVDTQGRRALGGLRRQSEGYGGAFRLVPIAEEAPLPRDTVAGETVRIHVIVANALDGSGLANGEVSVHVTP